MDNRYQSHNVLAHMGQDIAQAIRDQVPLKTVDIGLQQAKQAMADGQEAILRMPALRTRIEELKTACQNCIDGEFSVADVEAVLENELED